MENQLIIFDTTLRDGEQAPGFSMTVDQKLRLALQLERLGVDVMEAGFPIASTGDFESVKQIAQKIRKCSVAGLCRTKQEDIDRAWEALQHAKNPRIHTFIATSDIHLKYKLCMERQQVLDLAAESVRYAKNLTEDVEFSAEDAVRSDLDFLCQVIKAVIEAGATTVNIPDTVGYSIPVEFGEMIRTIKEKVSNIDKAIISVHCHNDLGLSVANSIAALKNGAQQVECTINGIGERAGNASLEEIVMAVHTRKDLFNMDSKIQTKEIYKSSQLLCHLTGMHVQRNKAIVGANAFAHEAGIHQHGVMKNAMTYEIMTPQSVGIPESKLVLGKHSGRHALEKRYKELGYQLTKDELDQAYQSFTNLADKKKSIYDADLIAILQDEVVDIPETYIFKDIQIFSGTSLTPTATVIIKNGKETIQDSATGDGPVDAACKAIDRLTGVKGKLIDYSIQAVTTGKDAMGEVMVRMEYNGGSYAGRSASTDVVEASAKAYLNAINHAMYSKYVQQTQV